MPRKGLTRNEAEDICAAGLRIHTVFETSGGANIAGFPQDGNYFTREQGHQDWTEAVIDATLAYQPTETPIFLAVDRHMPANDPRLVAYFLGAQDADTSMGVSGYLIGCYGPDYVCKFVRDTLGIRHLWPWLPRPPAIPDFDYDLWQQENGATLCGVSVDYNDCQVEGWRIGESMPDYVTREEFALYQENVRATLEAMKAAYDPIAAAYPQHAHDTTAPRPIFGG